MTRSELRRDRPAKAPVEPEPPRPSARLSDPLPHPLAIGAGTALLLRGTLASGVHHGRRPRIRLDGVECEVDGCGPGVAPGSSGLSWWSLLSIPAGAELPRSARLDLLADDGEGVVAVPLATVRIAPRDAAPTSPGAPGEGDRDEPRPPPTIAICMATYEPRRDELERQLESIRGQTRTDWICLISDDHSSTASFREIEAAVDGDRRFRLSRAPERGGFYRNFERALAMVPAEVELVALSDQDDRWHPDKLDALAAALAEAPGAELAYSDMRVISGDGTLISDTFWYQSFNAYEDVATLALVNTVTGAASLFRRRLLDLALPFPPAFSDQHYHDHWLALCALAVGEIAYLDRPTYDYTRHAESVTLRASAHWSRPPSGLWGRLELRARRTARRLRMAAAPGAWRDVYFDRFLLIRQLVAVLELRAGARIEPAKRRRLRLLADADRSPAGAAFLLGRALRSAIGRDVTLGRARVLLGGLLWRWGFALGSRIRASRG